MATDYISANLCLSGVWWSCFAYYPATYYSQMNNASSSPYNDFVALVISRFQIFTDFSRVLLMYVLCITTPASNWGETISFLLLTGFSPARPPPNFFRAATWPQRRPQQLWLPAVFDPRREGERAGVWFCCSSLLHLKIWPSFLRQMDSFVVFVVLKLRCFFLC